MRRKREIYEIKERKGVLKHLLSNSYKTNQSFYFRIFHLRSNMLA